MTTKFKRLSDKIHWAWEETYLKGNIDALDEIYATDVVIHAPPFPDENVVDFLKRHASEGLQAYTDIRFDWEETIAEGDTIVDRYLMHMKHTGRLQTLPILPTGKDLTVKCCRIYHVKDGRIV